MGGRSRAIVAVLLTVLFSGGCGGVCRFLEIGPAREINVDDFAPLPDSYVLVDSEGSCGQGEVPIDCGRSATVELPNDAVAPTDLGVLHDHLADRGWERCQDIGTYGRCYEIDEYEPDRGIVEVQFSHFVDPPCS